MTNQGSMSPVVPGSLDAANIVYRPPIPTALSLMRLATIMGINPLQFMGADITGLFPVTGCVDQWRQYSWQDEHKSSRDELAVEVHQAEKDIAAQLGYWPGPLWVTDDEVQYPKYHKPGYVAASGRDVAGRHKSVHIKYGRFLSGGVRDVEYIATATFLSSTLTIVDEDGDGFAETVLLSVATPYTSPYNHKIYLSNMGGAQEWEIRPVNTKVLSGGTLEIRIPIQLLFRPEILAAFPGEGSSLDISTTDTDNLVGEVDVYYETADPSQGSLFHWNESDLFAHDVEQTTQLIGLEPKVINRVASEVTLTPATYDSGTGKLTAVPFTIAREPDYVSLSYLSGAYQNDVRTGTRVVPDDLANAITKLAIARLARPMCKTCATVKEKEKLYRTDLSFSVDSDDGNVRFVTPETLRNPFGTRVGEVEAWKIIQGRLKDGDFAPQVAGF